MSSGLYSIGVSGVAAAQLGLLATEHNVANANTPGYTRQRTVQATNIAINTGAGSIGQGVHVQTIERLYDRYLTGQVNSATTKLAEIDAYYLSIKQIDNLLADPSAGLSPALQDFFSGVQQVAANPALLSARQSMISSAQTLVSRFQSIEGRLDELTATVNGQIGDAVKSINSYATEIADLNQRIVIAESSTGQPANDLLDQRDQLIKELNGLIKVSTTTNSDGAFNVFVGSGQQLVVGSRAMEMTARPSTADPGKIVVGLATVGGGSLELPEKLVVGGQLGGLIAFRSETLSRAQNELGRIAASVALTFNAQHALGQDLIGQASGDAGFNADFFTMALAGPSVLPDGNNGGTAVLTASFAATDFGPEVTDGNFFTNLKASDYLLQTTDGTTFSLTRLSDGAALTSGTLAAVSSYAAQNEGFQFSLTSGAFAAGNRFLIQPVRNAANNLAVNSVIAADSRMVAAALPFRTSAGSANTGSGGISAGTSAPGFATSLLSGSGITLTYASNQLTLTGISAGQTLTYQLPGGAETTVSGPAYVVPYAQGMQISVSGMTAVMSGVPNTNDTFTLARNTAATADGRNALALGKLQTQNTMAGDGVQGKATFQAAYAELVAYSGIKTRELNVTGTAQQAVLDQAQATRDALSGVNLDEEAANLLRFQQAYQASAKLLEVGKTLFDTLLQIG